MIMLLLLVLLLLVLLLLLLLLLLLVLLLLPLLLRLLLLNLLLLLVFVLTWLWLRCEQVNKVAKKGVNGLSGINDMLTTIPQIFMGETDPNKPGYDKYAWHIRIPAVSFLSNLCCSSCNNPSGTPGTAVPASARLRTWST